MQNCHESLTSLFCLVLLSLFVPLREREGEREREREREREKKKGERGKKFSRLVAGTSWTPFSIGNTLK